MRPARSGAGAIAVLAAALVGCAGPGRTETTFLRAVDLVEMTDRMSASLAQSPEIASRDAASEPWLVSLSKVTNQTNQILPEGEKWLYLARLRSLLAQSALARERAIVWIMPAEKWRMVADELDEAVEPASLRATPTHVLAAEFLALTSTSAGGRSDAYLCDYQLVSLESGRIVWEDRWEVKRSISGRTWD